MSDWETCYIWLTKDRPLAAAVVCADRYVWLDMRTDPDMGQIRKEAWVRWEEWGASFVPRPRPPAMDVFDRLNRLRALPWGVLPAADRVELNPRRETVRELLGRTASSAVERLQRALTTVAPTETIAVFRFPADTIESVTAPSPDRELFEALLAEADGARPTAPPTPPIGDDVARQQPHQQEATQQSRTPPDVKGPTGSRRATEPPLEDQLNSSDARTRARALANPSFPAQLAERLLATELSDLELEAICSRADIPTELKHRAHVDRFDSMEPSYARGALLSSERMPVWKTEQILQDPTSDAFLREQALRHPHCPERLVRQAITATDPTVRYAALTAVRTRAIPVTTHELVQARDRKMALQPVPYVDVLEVPTAAATRLAQKLLDKATAGEWPTP